MNEPQQPEMRRLGIIDLMAITTAVAVAFSLNEAARSETDISSTLWIFYPYLFVGAMTLGISLPAIYWIPVHYARTGKMFSQPGHWMLGAQFVVSAWSICYLITYILLKKPSFEIGETFFAIAFFLYGGFQLAAMIISIIAAFKLEKVRWKIVSILLAVSFASQGLGQAVQGISWLDGFDFLYRFQWIVDVFKIVVGLIAAIGITVAVLVDWKSKVSRDWLHRVGLVVMLATLTLLPLLQFLFVRLLMSQNQ